MTNKEAAKWIQLYIDLAKIDPTTGEAAYLNDDARKTIEAMEMAINALTAQSEETHDKRTEMHACDLIDRQALMKEFSDFVRASNNSDFARTPTWNDAVSLVESMPSVQPEIIHCKDCKFWREHKYAKETKRYIPFCGFNAIYTKNVIASDDFCSRAERRTDG